MDSLAEWGRDALRAGSAVVSGAGLRRRALGVSGAEPDGRGNAGRLRLLPDRHGGMGLGSAGGAGGPPGGGDRADDIERPVSGGDGNLDGDDLLPTGL